MSSPSPSSSSSSSSSSSAVAAADIWISPLSLAGAFAFTLCGALLMVFGVSFLRAKGVFSPLVGRKLMHLLTGPVYLLCWPLFPLDPLTTQPSLQSAIYAASVPALVSLYFVANALQLVNDEKFIRTVSRSGKSSELLEGPFLYGLIHSLAAGLFWLYHPAGMIGLLILCAGDGVADLIGRPFGTIKIPWNKQKSVQGSAAFAIVSYLACMSYGSFFFQLGYFSNIPQDIYASSIPIIVVCCTIVETLPIEHWDNVTVFLANVILAKILL